MISLLVLASVLALCLPLFDMVYLYPSMTSLLSEKARQDAENLGRFLAGEVIREESEQEIGRQLQHLTETFSLVRASLRSPAGKVLYSTEAKQIGQLRDLAPLRRALSRGESYSRFFFASPAGQSEIVSLIETQAPLVRAGELVAVLELIHDMGTLRRSLDRSVSHASAFLLLVSVVLFVVILLLAGLTRRAIKQQHQAEQLLQDSQQQLERKHQELNSLFLQVEQAKYEWQMALDCIAEMILLVDEENRVRRCNEPLVRFVGLSYPAILGKNWKTILFAEGAEEVSLNQQHNEIYHPRLQVWLAIAFYPYREERAEKLTVIRIQKLSARRDSGEK